MLFRSPSTSAPAEGNESENGVGRKAEGFERREAPKTVARRKPRSEPVAAPAPAPSDTAPEPAPAPSVAAPTAVAEPAPGPPEAIRVVARTSAGRAAPGDRVHTVQPGESLWSIAADLLGERATVARTARAVNRLWELNDDRIASGDPDLLFAGTRLRLR